MRAYDAIVIGTGGVGSAALFQLAQRGLRALGLDRFPAGHDRGSSHGETRIIRQAYFEHPNYVPLLRRAYELWRDLEARSGHQLYSEVGLLEVGPADGEVVPGVLASARLHGLEVERLSPSEVSQRFPGFVLGIGLEAVFEQQAGYLLVEKCVLAHLAEAEKLGAELRTGEAVVEWEARGNEVIVNTTAGRYSARRLVVTAGAWASQLLSRLGVPLRVLKKHLHWFENRDDRYQQAHGCPAFFYEAAGGLFYGFPVRDGLGLKVADHSGGLLVDDPLNVDRSLDLSERRRVENFLELHLPGVSHRPTHHAVCLYTMSPDSHFLIDTHPDHENVAFAAGLSGHGFKFTSVLGQILADFVIDGHTELPVDFLRCSRFNTSGRDSGLHDRP